MKQHEWKMVEGFSKSGTGKGKFCGILSLIVLNHFKVWCQIVFYFTNKSETSMYYAKDLILNGVYYWK